MGVYADGGQEQKLRSAAAAIGRTLDMGKSCLRFKTIDNLPMAAIGALIASRSVEDYIAIYQASREDVSHRDSQRS